MAATGGREGNGPVATPGLEGGRGEDDVAPNGAEVRVAGSWQGGLAASAAPGRPAASLQRVARPMKGGASPAGGTLSA